MHIKRQILFYFNQDNKLNILNSNNNYSNFLQRCYDEFAQFYALMGSGKIKVTNPIEGILRKPPVELLKRLTDFLKQKGVVSLFELKAFFKKADKNNNGYLDREEF